MDLLTSHNLEEVEQLADRAAMLVAGQIRRQGTLAEMHRTTATETVISFHMPTGLLSHDLPESARQLCRVERGDCEIRTSSPTAVLAGLTGWAAGRGVELVELQVRCPRLGDVYMELVQQHGHEEARVPR